MSGDVIEFPPSRLTRAQQAFVTEALPMVRQILARLYWRGCGVVRWEDLISIGQLKLAEVVRMFDPGRGVPFEAYAWPAVHGAMRDALRNEARMQQVVRLGAYNAIDVQLDEGDPESFGDALVAGMLANLQGEPMRTEDAEADELFREALALLRRAMSELSSEDQRLIKLHYNEHLPLEQVGNQMGMGRTVIKARHRGMLKRLVARLGWLGIRGGPWERA
jgi:RNA polymerase sigma factor FliA